MNIDQLRYPRYIGIKHKITYELPEVLFVEQWRIPKGTVVTTWQTQNFGWVKLPTYLQDKRGFVIPKSLFRY